MRIERQEIAVKTKSLKKTKARQTQVEFETAPLEVKTTVEGYCDSRKRPKKRAVNSIGTEIL